MKFTEELKTAQNFQPDKLDKNMANQNRQQFKSVMTSNTYQIIHLLKELQGGAFSANAEYEWIHNIR